MIGKISGTVDYVADDHALIEAGGVGYVIYCSARTLAGLPGPGEAAALYTEMVVREDLLQLYGFPTVAEKEWHRLLCSVQGVGAKVALAILGTLGPEGVGRAITLGDAAAIRAAPGVGPKLAARIALELREKAPTVMAMGRRGALTAMAGVEAASVEATTPAPAVRKPRAPRAADARAGLAAAARADAMSALVNLGYAPGDAAGAVATVVEGGATEAPALIRAALRLLAPREG